MKFEGETLAAATRDRETCLHTIEEATAYLSVLDRVIAEFTGRGGAPQLAAKKPRRRTGTARTGPSVQREIEIFCFAEIKESAAKLLSTAALLGLVEKEFGSGRTSGAITQMLATCPCFVRVGGGKGKPPASWRNVTEDEWAPAYAHALERKWPGSDDFEYATEGIDEDAEEESEGRQGDLSFG